ncbi:tyrosinase family oxidase copper chaperone [Streptomyces sp. NPDC060194]|uniref:tyrosinase family oxidase copper chaperone n=1 Tax=Streptomyces sp. NPDC060194 TaxID=3347069 RepID=UPI0036659AEB
MEQRRAGRGTPGRGTAAVHGRRAIRLTPPGPVRRRVLQALSALSVTAFTGGALARIVAAPPAGPAAEPVGDSVLFDETYRGRHLTARAAPGAAPRVFVDGRPLHLMRCAGGGYVTPLDHYQSYPTPLAAARGAVAELGTQQLALTPVHGGRVHGGGHGVRA